MAYEHVENKVSLHIDLACNRVMSRRRQRCLSDFVSSATATSSSRASEDEEPTTRLSSDLNNDDGAIAEESSEPKKMGVVAQNYCER